MGTCRQSRVRPRRSNVIDAVRQVAERRGLPMTQVALAWLGARPGVSSVILGARTTEQLESNLGAIEVALDADETAALDTASHPHPTDYPYGELGIKQRSRRPEGG
jgi:aryl-alcohol dehydrogenase-like predicted oxidoreductase